MYCRNCGTDLNNEAKFCIKCGLRPLNGNAYCQWCGAETTVQQEICVKCGCRLKMSTATSAEGGYLKKLSTMELISAIAWTVIAALQAISAINSIGVLLTVGSYAGMLGLDGVLGGSWVNVILLLAVAGWNAYISYQTYGLSKALKENPPHDLIQRYEKNLVSLIVMLVVMLLVSWIGALGAVYNLVIRGYVLSHKEAIQQEVADVTAAVS